MWGEGAAQRVLTYWAYSRRSGGPVVCVCVGERDRWGVAAVQSSRASLLGFGPHAPVEGGSCVCIWVYMRAVAHVRQAPCISHARVQVSPALSRVYAYSTPPPPAGPFVLVWGDCRWYSHITGTNIR